MTPRVRVETPSSTFVLTGITRAHALRLRGMFRGYMEVQEDTWVLGDAAHRWLRRGRIYGRASWIGRARLRCLIARPCVKVIELTPQPAPQRGRRKRANEA